ncbi:MAG: capsular biosynthesis protein [Paenibacillaceae bacterium]|nr:capsular biosynthesis protein [Paenibacillaceae bacterium]
MPRLTADQPVIMDVNPDSSIAEAYRALRTNIEFSSVGKEMRIIMITSASRGEGKSTTAVNLAISLSQAGKRVLLIDADMRNSSIHRILRIDNKKGLANYLALQTELPEIITPTHIPNLSVIPSGTQPPNPAELLTMNQMDHLLGELKKDFHTIILDTPSALSVTDAQIIAAKSDGVLLVVEQGFVKREAAKKVKAYLKHVNARLLGVVFNKINKANLDSYAGR